MQGTVAWGRARVPARRPTASRASFGASFARGAWIRSDRIRTARPGLTGALPPISRFFRRPTSTDSTESAGSVDLQDPPPSNPSEGDPEESATAGDAGTREEEGPFALGTLWEEMRDVTLMGKRGEGWFVAQVIAVALVLFPPVSLDGLLGAAGVLAIGMGLVFTVSAVLSLGRNICPFPYPRPSSKGIVTDGMYQYVRHPMYGGLMLICLGISAISGSEARFLLTLVLWWAMEKKVEFEEAKLIERFPEYEKYRSGATKFIPFVY